MRGCVGAWVRECVIPWVRWCMSALVCVRNGIYCDTVIGNVLCVYIVDLYVRVRAFECTWTVYITYMC